MTTVSDMTAQEPISQMTFLSAEYFKRSKSKGGRQKVAAYIRVSTDMADQENSYEAQEKYFRHLLEQNREWISAGVYSDYGISGTCHEKRIGFRRILRHCREGKIDRIICKSISRFARNTTDFMMALDILNESGVTIMFEREGLDTADPTSSFILTTLGAIAQEESRSISDNIRWGNEMRYPRGDVCNRDIYGYRFTEEIVTMESGYGYRAVEIIPEEAQVACWIFEQVAEGRAYKDIARELNQRHIPRKVSAYTRKRMKHSAKGQLNSEIDEGWTDSQIRNMVRNERYTGDVLVQKTYTVDYLTHRKRANNGEVAQYLIKNHHPAIISRELFEEVKKVWEGKTEAAVKTARIPRVFSGRLICGCCGRYYHVRNTRNSPIWYCPSTTRNNGKNLCRNEKVYEKQIVRMLRKGISQRFHLVSEPMIETIDDLGVEQMLTRLENIQQMDFVEQDRAFMKRQMLGEDLAAEMAEGKKARISEDEKEKVAERLQYLEGYWEELEENQECRDKAIGWMKSLPPDRDGVEELLDGMTDSYMQAFVLSVTIHDLLHYTVHWFDDTWTKVELHSNIKSKAQRKNGI